MPSAYPGAVDSLPRPSPTDTMDTPGLEGDVVIDALADAIQAIQEILGTDPQGDSATVRERLESLASANGGGMLVGILEAEQTIAWAGPGSGAIPPTALVGASLILAPNSLYDLRGCFAVSGIDNNGYVEVDFTLPAGATILVGSTDNGLGDAGDPLNFYANTLPFETHCYWIGHVQTSETGGLLQARLSEPSAAPDPHSITVHQPTYIIAQRVAIGVGGAFGVVNFLGEVDEVGDLPAEGGNGDAYFVTSFDPPHLFIWSEAGWVDGGSLQGQPGADGDSFVPDPTAEPNGRGLAVQDGALVYVDAPVLHYAHNQELAATNWTITHNLGRFPSVTVIDSANQQVEGELEYLSANQLRVSFNASFSGKAYLN